MKYSILFLITFLYFNTASSQVVTLKGVVSDSLNEPLDYVTLIAKPFDVDMSMQFAATNSMGAYELELSKNMQYTISVSLLGFKAHDFKYTPLKDIEKNIEMVEDVTQLDPVTVIMELPISVKKDTIIYKIDQFVTGEERKLKDIIEKLPGVEVDNDGNITSQGKKVTHVLVEDKSFFGGNSKLAVENIPANSVNKIEFIDDYNEISFLKGMTRNDDMAMNVKLKENKKNFVFGDIEAGKGNKSFYKTHANLFYYHPELNVNFIGGLNNNGEKAFTSKDYENFIGGSSVVSNPSDFIAEKNTLSESIETNDVIKSESKIGALNFTRTISDKIDLSSYLIYSGSDSESRIETNNEYLLPDTNILENVVNKRSANNKLGLGKIKLKYTPNDLEQLSFDMLAKARNNLGLTSIISIIDFNEQNFEDIKDTDEAYVNGNLEWHKKLSNKNAFSADSSFEYDKNNAISNWNTNRAIAEGLIPFEPSDFYKLRLLREVKKKGLSGIFKYYWNINNFNLVHITFGNQYKDYQFLTDDSQLLSNGGVNNFSSNNFGNDLSFKLNDLYLGIYYNAQVGEFEFIQSIFLHNYAWSIDQSNLIKKNKWVLLPDVSIRRRSSSSGAFLRLDSNGSSLALR